MAVLRFTGYIWQFREYIEDRLALHRKDDESFKSFREVREESDRWRNRRAGLIGNN